MLSSCSAAGAVRSGGTWNCAVGWGAAESGHWVLSAILVLFDAICGENSSDHSKKELEQHLSSIC